MLCTTSTNNSRVSRATREDERRGYRTSLIGVLMATLWVGPAVGLAESPAPTQLPTGEQVVGGAAAVSRQQATMTIDQSTSRAAIDWHGFDIGSQAQVNIRQPSTDSVLLNRIMGASPSQIFGSLSANGQVYLSNPNGLYFAPSASVNVGGLVATTHSLSLEEFMAGRNQFTRHGATGRIVNEGQLKARLGGYIALLAPEVRNNGVIVAELGTVALAAGEAYELRFDSARRLAGLRVEPAQIHTLVENRQAVLTPGGLILLSAQGMSQLQGSVIRHDGTLDASSLVGRGGRILLEGDVITLSARSKTAATGTTGGGEVLVGGGWQGSGPLKHATSTTMESGATIDVSATQHGDGGTAVLWSDIHNPNSMTTVAGSIFARGGLLSGNGGRIDTSGHYVDIRHARVTAGASMGLGGEWLIDPYNYTIAASAASTIVGALNSGTSVTVDTASDAVGHGSSGNNTDAGDITVTSAITPGAMTGNATLTLKAKRHIELAAGGSIDATQNGNTARLNLKLWADSDNSGDGINIVTAPTLATNGGTLTFGNGDTAVIGGNTVKVGGDVYFNGTQAQTISTGGGAITIQGETLVANVSVGGLTFNSGGGPIVMHGVLNSSNQYAYVDGPDGEANSWDWARTAAKGSTQGGAATGDSYLVTINSRLENAIAGKFANYGGAWLGAYRASPASSYDWQWADGPEAGQIFFVQSPSNGGTIQPGGYANFASGEPNGALNSTGESRGQFFGPQGEWNDLRATTSFSTPPGSTYSVLGYVRETNLDPSKVTINAGAGNFTVGAVGGNKALASLTVTAASSTVNGIVLKTTGAQSFSSRLTVSSSGAFDLIGSALSVGGPLSITAANNVALGAPTTVAGAIDVRGAQIALNTDLTSSQTGDIFIKSNAATNASIRLDPAASIFKTGGARSTLTMQADGRISINGDIVASGSTPLDVVLWSDYLDAGAGGVSLLNNVATNGGHLWVGGSNSSGGSSVWNGLTVGDGPSNGALLRNWNALDFGSAVTTGGGDVLLWADTPYSSGIQGIGLTSSSTIDAGSGRVTLIADQISNGGGSALLTVNSTGHFTWTPGGGDFGAPFTWVGSTSGGNFAHSDTNAKLVLNNIATLGGLTLGRYTGTGLAGDTTYSNMTNNSNVTIDSAMTIAGPIGVHGGNVVINAPLTSTGSHTITLQGTGTVTGGSNGSLVADRLALLGGDVTLDHVGNNVGTLAASGVGALTYVDSNALTVGIVNPTGITATGPVRIETLSGDLTVAQNITTSDVSDSAIILNAGKSAAAGTPTGGDLLISGVPTLTTGTGGRATLYSGSASGSTGVTPLIGSGSGRFRYNSDESATNYTAALGSGLHAIYRESPSMAVRVDNKTIIYGNVLPPLTYTTSGLNGDTLAQVFASPSVLVGGATNSSGHYAVGSYTLTPSGMTTSQLGYAIGTHTNGTLTVLESPQQPLGGTTQLSRGIPFISGSPPTMPPQSAPISGFTTSSTGAVELTKLFPSDGLLVNWIREQSDHDTRVVTVSIPESMITRGDPISFALPVDLIKTLQATPDQFTQADGNDIPAWLAYDQTVGNFKITDPAAISSWPYEVVATMNDQRVLVKIDKRSN